MTPANGLPVGVLAGVVVLVGTGVFVGVENPDATQLAKHEPSNNPHPHINRLFGVGDGEPVGFGRCVCVAVGFLVPVAAPAVPARLPKEPVVVGLRDGVGVLFPNHLFNVQTEKNEAHGVGVADGAPVIDGLGVAGFPLTKPVGVVVLAFGTQSPPIVLCIFGRHGANGVVIGVFVVTGVFVFAAVGVPVLVANGAFVFAAVGVPVFATVGVAVFAGDGVFVLAGDTVTFGYCPEARLRTS